MTFASGQCAGRRLAGLFSAVLLAGCASSPESGEQSSSAGGVGDPYESFNRGVYAFNTAIDNATTKPLARGYGKITPRIARQGVSNFFDNLGTPRSAVNNFLQGKPARGRSPSPAAAACATAAVR